MAQVSYNICTKLWLCTKGLLQPSKGHWSRTLYSVCAFRWLKYSCKPLEKIPQLGAPGFSDHCLAFIHFHMVWDWWFRVDIFLSTVTLKRNKRESRYIQIHCFTSRKVFIVQQRRKKTDGKVEILKNWQIITLLTIILFVVLCALYWWFWITVIWL